MMREFLQEQIDLGISLKEAMIRHYLTTNLMYMWILESVEPAPTAQVNLSMLYVDNIKFFLFFFPTVSSVKAIERVRDSWDFLVLILIAHSMGSFFFRVHGISSETRA